MENLEMLKPSIRKRQKRRDKRMGEELIECYRTKSWEISSKTKGYDKRNVGNDFQWAKSKEGMKIRSGGTKYQTDNLKPLVRYLESKQGKFWDKVYSDLCQKMDKNTLLGQHLFDHLMDFVETKVTIESGRIMSLSSWGGLKELYSGFYPQFYVHPKSGVLLKVKKKRR
ncbi:MAG: hypothetical protein AAF391_01535 [Bacteroidota bacterium]